MQYTLAQLPQIKLACPQKSGARVPAKNSSRNLTWEEKSKQHQQTAVRSTVPVHDVRTFVISYFTVYRYSIMYTSTQQ